MNEGSDDDNVDSDPFKSKFSSDDEDDFLDNTGAEELANAEAAFNSSDMFDSLKEDTSAKKPPKRKLGAKVEVVEPPTKRPKSNVSLDSSEDSPIKV